MPHLTARQREVLLLAANGNTNTAIGQHLGIHRTTVDRHLAEIYLRLGAQDRAHAAAIAVASGVIGAQEIRIPDPRKKAAA